MQVLKSLCTQLIALHSMNGFCSNLKYCLIIDVTLPKKEDNLTRKNKDNLTQIIFPSYEFIRAILLKDALKFSEQVPLTFYTALLVL